MPTPSETILQFGSGRFLRAFADLFIHQAAERGDPVGKVVIVQSTGGERAGGLNQQGGRYHVVIRGIESGRVVERVETCTSISRALVALAERGVRAEADAKAQLKASYRRFIDEKEPALKNEAGLDLIRSIFGTDSIAEDPVR